MESCDVCARLLKEMRKKSEEKQVAENALVLSGTNQQFSSARKALDSANLAWTQVTLEYQDHMQREHPRSDNK
jgi:uncharacterized glyoxalase superfamily metalloenzyme YdcJ